MPSVFLEDDESEILSGTFLTTDKNTQENFVEIYSARLGAASVDEDDSINT